MFMRNRYNILFSLFWASLVLVGIETQAQENLKFAPNDIPVPWYSQKITGCPYTHCSLASSLMVFDYFKGMTADAQRTSSDAEKKLIEYQRNYFFKETRSLPSSYIDRAGRILFFRNRFIDPLL